MSDQDLKRQEKLQLICAIVSSKDLVDLFALRNTVVNAANYFGVEPNVDEKEALKLTDRFVAVRVNSLADQILELM
jgi:hypothetical protein